MTKVLSLLAFASMGTIDPIRISVGFLVLIVVLAILIIGGRWLLDLAGFVVPQPLKYIAGLIVFLVLLLLFLDWAGIYHI